MSETPKQCAQCGEPFTEAAAWYGEILFCSFPCQRKWLTIGAWQKAKKEATNEYELALCDRQIQEASR